MTPQNSGELDADREFPFIMNKWEAAEYAQVSVRCIELAIAQGDLWSYEFEGETCIPRNFIDTFLENLVVVFCYDMMHDAHKQAELDYMHGKFRAPKYSIFS